MSKKSNTKFQRRYINDIYEHMEKGGSIDTFTAFLHLKYKLKIYKKTAKEWIEKYSEFALAVEDADNKYLSYLEGLREMALLGKAPKGSKGINLKTVEFILKTRFNDGQDDKRKAPQIVIVRAKDADDSIGCKS